MGYGAVDVDVRKGAIEVTDGNLAGMTDEEVVAHYRQAYPHMSAGRALALHSGEVRYRHLLVAAQEQERLKREYDQERIRRKIFGADEG